MTTKTSNATLSILVALGLSHLLNDLLQSVLTASYPIIKSDLDISFAQIGLVTLVYQLAASVFQPIVGLFFDKHPISWCPMLAMSLTSVGITMLAWSNSLTFLFIAVFIIGLGSSIIHPEASRIASLASGGKRGLAQSIFQVGGNIGGSVGPLLVALIVAPFGRQNILWFLVFALIAFIVAMPIQRWFSHYLNTMKVEHRPMKVQTSMPLSRRTTILTIGILLVLIFSKYIYMASISSYYTFYLIEKFGISIRNSQVCLFIFLAATAIGTLIGGPVGDRIGRKYVIWISILGTAPFSLAMPYADLYTTIALSFGAGLMLSSAFPAILLYAQELLPYNLGLVSGLFFGLAFGIAGIASAAIGNMADTFGLETVYNVCAYMPLLGIVAGLLPNLKSPKKQ
ncbi:MAG: MFS transporter [Bacteroidales bacterium]|nr:MFS transporter [Bacteroidales bacterium]